MKKWGGWYIGLGGGLLWISLDRLTIFDLLPTDKKIYTGISVIMAVILIIVGFMDKKSGG